MIKPKQAMEEKIVLDKESFKALAADNRVRILKILYKRRHMQAEIAGELGMSQPAAREHLTAMAKAGLIVKKDEGRKWKYYELTNKGRAILDPEQKRIWIVLSLFVLTIAGGLTAYFRTLLSPLYAGQALRATAPESLAAEAEALAAERAVDAGAADLAIPAAEAAESAGIPLGIILFGVWILILLVILIYSFIKRRQYLGKDLTNK